MKDEIKEMLDNIKDIVDDYIKICNYNQDEVIYDEINYSPKQWYLLLDYITNLQQKVENQRQELVSLNDRLKEVKKSNGFLKQKVKQYENPDDMTLFYMWLDVKAKDKIKQLKQENERLNNIISELEKILQEDFENNRNYYDYPRIYLDKLKELKEKE